MEIKWLRRALQNLDSEATHIAKANPAAAQMVVQSIHHAVSQLSENPALGHPGRIDGTRELVVPDTRHIVPYRVVPRLNRVEILRVFHTSRKLPESWL